MRGSGPHTIVSVGESLPEQALDTAVDPTEIVQQSFDTERRGFDQKQVQQYLRAVADSLRDAQQREALMRGRLGRAVRRAESAEQALRKAPAHIPVEPKREFVDQASSALEVDTVLQDGQADTELAATEIVGDGQVEAQSIREKARVDADAMLSQAADQVQRSRDECDALVREAEEARAQILDDLERRRRQARAQVERLRVGRDRLLRSYEVVRRTLEEATVDLKSSLQEAKVRGDGAARAVASEPLASRKQLEAELRDAKMIGRITISDLASPSLEDSIVTNPLRSPDLARPFDALKQEAGTPLATRRPRVSEAMEKGALATQPKAPAIAPALKASAIADAPEDPIAAMMAAAEAKRASTAATASVDLEDPNSEDLMGGGPDSDVSDSDVDAIRTELVQLKDKNLNVIEPSDKIEEVVAVPLVGAKPDAVARGLFAALRAQRSARKSPGRSAAKKATLKVVTIEQVAPQEITDFVSAQESTAFGHDQGDASVPVGAIAGIEAQRDAVIADAAKQFEKRLKRALADEQNDVLAGIRSAKRNVSLTAIIGDVDTHINRYVIAIHEVAAVTYGAGAALIDVQAPEGHLPAGAVEELLESDVVLPIRQHLALLDDLGVEAADLHVDPVRAFYRQRKTDHLGMAASRLANLLCVAGLCDALPEKSPMPWAITAK
jgi:DivIVA domain-containing protein